MEIRVRWRVCCRRIDSNRFRNGQRPTYTVLLAGFQKFEQQRGLRFEELVVIGRRDVSKDFQIKRVVSNFGEANRNLRRLNQRVITKDLF